MTTFEVRAEVDKFVLQFDTYKNEINAYAFASALVNLSDAVKIANNSVNPGYQVEVVVEAISQGSFRATIKTLFVGGRDLFGKEAAKAIIYGIISTHIYEKAIKTDEPTQIIIKDGSVIMQSGKDKIIVPRQIYDAKKLVEKSEKFNTAVNGIFESAEKDKNVKGIALNDDISPTQPPFYISREKFQSITNEDSQHENIRELFEETHLEISRAILARGRRKWEFVWRGITISAPILDNNFFDKFIAHEVTIAPGDSLEVKLKITQEKHSDTGIFINKGYEVLEVKKHNPRLKQATMNSSLDQQ